jgi:hypothetical protein
VPYENVKEMDASNSSFDTIDVVIVIGPNDVVNPEARTDPSSPLPARPFWTSQTPASPPTRPSTPVHPDVAGGVGVTQIGRAF